MAKNIALLASHPESFRVVETPAGGLMLSTGLYELTVPELREFAKNLDDVLRTHYPVDVVTITEDAAGSIKLRRPYHTANIIVGQPAVVLRQENGAMLVAQEIDGHWYRGIVPNAITKPCLPRRHYDAKFVTEQLAASADDWKP